MALPYAHGRKVNSIFQFFGKHENGITNAFVWVLAKCPRLAQNFVNDILGPNIYGFNDYITSTQDYTSKDGITDIEMTDNKNFYLIVEAKYGWNLPGIDQLELYTRREKFISSPARHKAIVTMSECSQEYAVLILPPEINEVQIKHISWKEIYHITKKSIVDSTHKQKWLLIEFEHFMEVLTTMQKQESNWVYVVSLSDDMPEGWGISWIDIVKSRGLYFHPIGNSWPSEPPNYIAFRYGGRLQSIHHIESYDVFTDPHSKITEIPSLSWNPHFLYTLGKAIEPIKEVRTDGKRIPRAMRVWAMLDTLLTSDTIAEARDISKARQESP